MCICWAYFYKSKLLIESKLKKEIKTWKNTSTILNSDFPFKGITRISIFNFIVIFILTNFKIRVILICKKNCWCLNNRFLYGDIKESKLTKMNTLYSRINKTVQVDWFEIISNMFNDAINLICGKSHLIIMIFFLINLH